MSTFDRKISGHTHPVVIRGIKGKHRMLHLRRKHQPMIFKRLVRINEMVTNIAQTVGVLETKPAR